MNERPAPVKTVSSSTRTNELDLYTGEDPDLPPGPLPSSLVRSGPARTTHPPSRPSLRSEGCTVAIRIRRDQKEFLSASGFQLAGPVRQLLDAAMGKLPDLEAHRREGEQLRGRIFRELHEATVRQARELQEKEARIRDQIDKDVQELRGKFQELRGRFDGKLPRVTARSWIHDQKSWYRTLRNEHDVDLLKLLEAP